MEKSLLEQMGGTHRQRETIFCQTSLCRKAHLLVSGVSVGSGICGSIKDRSTPLYCSAES